MAAPRQRSRGRRQGREKYQECRDPKRPPAVKFQGPDELSVTTSVGSPPRCPFRLRSLELVTPPLCVAGEAASRLEVARGSRSSAAAENGNLASSFGVCHVDCALS